jgi:hypothetical protein
MVLRAYVPINYSPPPSTPPRLFPSRNATHIPPRPKATARVNTVTLRSSST